jgi:hypothetical protein
MTSYRNSYSTSPVIRQDLPHDYSRSPFIREPIIEDMDFVVYAWSILISVLSSASMTYAGAAAGGADIAAKTPIIAILGFMNLGHALISLMRGQGQ